MCKKNRWIAAFALCATAVCMFPEAYAAINKTEKGVEFPVSLSIPQSYRAETNAGFWKWTSKDGGRTSPKVTLTPADEEFRLVWLLEDNVIRLDSAKQIEVNGMPAMRLRCVTLQSLTTAPTSAETMVWFKVGRKYYVLQATYELKDEARALKDFDAILASIKAKS